MVATHMEAQNMEYLYMEAQHVEVQVTIKARVLIMMETKYMEVACM